MFHVVLNQPEIPPNTGNVIRLCANTGAAQRLITCSTRGRTRYSDVHYQAGDTLVLGPETRGLPQELLDTVPAAHRLRIPMVASSRSLNLSNAAAVIVYEAWRQLSFIGGQ